MLGAIIGDLAGSIYEYDEFKNKDININRRMEILSKSNLIDEDSFYSDDTILTIAILEAILDVRPYGDVLREYGLKYYLDEPDTNASHFKYMFSPNFIKWCKGEIKGESMGNGALMRVSPVGFLYDDLFLVLKESMKATIPSHNSYLSVVSAQTLNTLIYMGRQGYSKDELKDNFYPVRKSLDEIRLTNEFDSSCLVLEKCIVAFLESESFEDAIRKAISLGGDTDTIGAITGSLAEAYFSIPCDLKEAAFEKIPNDFALKLERGYQKVKKL